MVNRSGRINDLEERKLEYALGSKTKDDPDRKGGHVSAFFRFRARVDWAIRRADAGFLPAQRRVCAGVSQKVLHNGRT